MLSSLFTIGHSNHTIETFLELLQKHDVTAVADVRSSPFSQYAPQYNRENLQASLERVDLEYVFLGDLLGGRSMDPAYLQNGRIQYDRLARSSKFIEGIDRLLNGIEKYRIAILCSEKDPIDCHRAILICRQLRTKPVQISHILSDGSLESHPDFERRLVRSVGLPEQDLFNALEDQIARAYEIQAERVAYSVRVPRNSSEGE